MYAWGLQSPSLLGFYRPNQAMNLNYRGYGMTGLGAPPVFSIADLKSVRQLGHWKNVQQSHTGPGMGQDGTIAADPKLLLSGIGLLAAGMFLLGGKHGPKLRRRASRFRRKLRG